MTAEIIVVAITNGCSPKFQPGFGWFCDCDDNLHCCDQQCSLITEESAQRERREP